MIQSSQSLLRVLTDLRLQSLASSLHEMPGSPTPDLLSRAVNRRSRTC